MMHPSPALLQWASLLTADFAALTVLVGGVAALVWPVLTLPLILVALLGAIAWFVRSETTR